MELEYYAQAACAVKLLESRVNALIWVVAGFDGLAGMLAAERVRQQQCIVVEVLDLVDMLPNVPWVFISRIIPPFILGGRKQLSYNLGRSLPMSVGP